jgi:hypothetical protein
MTYYAEFAGIEPVLFYARDDTTAQAKAHAHAAAMGTRVTLVRCAIGADWEKGQHIYV